MLVGLSLDGVVHPGGMPIPSLDGGVSEKSSEQAGTLDGELGLDARWTVVSGCKPSSSF